MRHRYDDSLLWKTISESLSIQSRKQAEFNEEGIACLLHVVE